MYVYLGHINQIGSNNNQCANAANTGLPPVTRVRPRRNSNVADDDPAIHGTEMVMLYDYKVCINECSNYYNYNFMILCN